MPQPSDFLVWLQTTKRRDASCTIRSIERSDIRQRYHLLTDTKDRVFPDDYANLQHWWEQSWREMAEVARVRKCKWILRLEDDVLVNQHILHNVSQWAALESPKFGIGTLFCPDYWLRRPELFSTDPATGATMRQLKDVEGGQGQVVSTDRIDAILDGVPQARTERGLHLPQHQPSFDWSLSRAAWPLGLRVFVHIPALVNLHDGSLSSKIDLTQHRTGTQAAHDGHYWGNKSFDPSWKQGVSRLQSRAGSQVAEPLYAAPTGTR